MTPSTKVTAATLAAAVTIIAVWGIQASTAIEIPTGVSGAITTILTLLAGYVVKEQNPSPSARAAIDPTGRLGGE